MPKKGKSRKEVLDRWAKWKARHPGESYVDPVFSITERIHDRAKSARSPFMFELADKLMSYDMDKLKFSEDWGGAAHDCGIALREEAGITEFANYSEVMWRYAIEDWTKA